jgi:hypothetical protein
MPDALTYIKHSLTEYKYNKSNIVDDMITPNSLSIPATYPFALKHEKWKKVRGERKAQ